MTETPETQPEPAAAPADSTAERVNTLEEKVNRILGILSGGDSEPGPDAAPDTPDIAHQIREQLDARDRAQRDADEKKNAGDRLAAVEQQVKDMAERAPQAPLKRATRLMWGGRTE